MQFPYLFLVLAVVAVSSEVIDINDSFDESLANINNFLRKHRFTSAHIPEGTYGSHVSYSDSEVLGLDSLKRTDNCTLEIIDENNRFDYHYGFGLFQQSFKILNIYGHEMSGGYRVRNNSIHLSFTIHNNASCYVTLNDLSYERLSHVDFYSSRPEYDGIDVENYFENVIIPFLNNKINKETVQRSLQALCRKQHLQVSEHMPLIHNFILEQIGVPSQL